MRNILIRADSSSTIGTGHIMRDLVLAQQFTDANIIIATQDLPGNINHKIKEENYKIETLQSNNIEEVLKLIEHYSIEIIIIDHYGIDYDYEKELKLKTKVQIFVLDDTYEKHHCDILLNHNVYAEQSKYKGLIPDDCELRCGSEYTLLRQEFIIEKQNRRQINRPPKSCLVIMGGADHTNLNTKILKVLENFPEISAHVVTTTANQCLNELESFAKDKTNIKIHINTKQMAKLMNSSDFAIVTPSVTMNEVLFMEMPFIAIKTADNQNDMYEYLISTRQQSMCLYDSEVLKKHIEYMVNIEGIELINFTEMTLQEKETVLEWRNTLSIRKWMFNKEEIKLIQHLNYIESLKKQSNKLYFLVKKQGIDIGVIDFTEINNTEKTANLGIYANPSIKGVGSILLETIINFAFIKLHVLRLISEAFDNNFPAIKLYKKFMFRTIASRALNQQNVVTMELTNENW